MNLRKSHLAGVQPGSQSLELPGPRGAALLFTLPHKEKARHKPGFALSRSHHLQLKLSALSTSPVPL